MIHDLVIGRYEVDNTRGVLHIAGEGLEREVIEGLPFSKYTYTPKNKNNKIPGRATFISDSEKEAQELATNLEALLKGKKLKFEYRGKTALQLEKLKTLSSEKELHYLVYTTIAHESEGTINPEQLTPIDYIAEIKKLQKKK